jgi:DNA-binding MarR family transcriptional regulator
MGKKRNKCEETWRISVSGFRHINSLLKKLEQKGYLKRERSKIDERNLQVKITSSGESLKEKAKTVPEAIVDCIRLEKEDAINLHRILTKLLNNMDCKYE